MEASIRLLKHLSGRGDEAATWAGRIPLLSQDGTIARTGPQRLLLAPVRTWTEQAREFHRVYPSDRVLAGDYAGENDSPDVVAALVGWRIALPDPLEKRAPTDPIKDDRLRCLAEPDQDLVGVHVQGEEFSQIALLNEVIPRCLDAEVARALLGLVVRYVAPTDTLWREIRTVTARRGGADLPIKVRGALWLADLRARPWVPDRSGENPSQVMATSGSLRSLLDPGWLEGNESALDVLGTFFGFDELDLRLLGKPAQERKLVAQIVELVGAEPGGYVRLVEELQKKQARARQVERCKKLGLAVQAAVKLALEAQHLKVKVIDRGFDFEVSSDDLADAASEFEVGTFLVEVKATTTGEAKLTPKQAETASKEAHRYVLCVVDLRDVEDPYEDEAWTDEEVGPRTRMLAAIGGRVEPTWQLVERARTSDVELRNEGALRYAVPPDVWEGGCSIVEWVMAAFKKGSP